MAQLSIRRIQNRPQQPEHRIIAVKTTSGSTPPAERGLARSVFVPATAVFHLQTANRRRRRRVAIAGALLARGGHLPQGWRVADELPPRLFPRPVVASPPRRLVPHANLLGTHTTKKVHATFIPSQTGGFTYPPGALFTHYRRRPHHRGALSPAPGRLSSDPGAGWVPANRGAGNKITKAGRLIPRRLSGESRGVAGTAFAALFRLRQRRRADVRIPRSARRRLLHRGAPRFHQVHQPPHHSPAAAAAHHSKSAAFESTAFDALRRRGRSRLKIVRRPFRLQAAQASRNS